jgi:4-amino-4-deoxy-L-arabinose transferase-like glycosyltransferase
MEYLGGAPSVIVPLSSKAGPGKIMLSGRMARQDRLDALARGWRGPLLAAAVALVAALPGALALPPLDRDEARFAQASAQMLESGDFVTPRFQEEPRFKKPVGIYWLQAAAVKALSRVESRQIWPYRVPSVLGAMLAAAACAWGAAAFLRPGAALAAGAMLGASFLLSTEGLIASTDAVLCGLVTLAMAALARIYLAGRGGPPAGTATKAAFWIGLALSILVKGPIGPIVVVLTAASLCLWERRARWLASIGWGWGLIFLAAVIGPWGMAITVATDGAFWGSAIGGDLAPKLAGAAEGHGAPPGWYALLSPLLLFPATLLLPAGLAAGWRAAREPAVRFAWCWLVPSWLVFELAPTKLIHYVLPTFGALAWLMARALAQPIGPIARGVGAGLALLAALAFAAAGPWAMVQLHEQGGLGWSALAGLLFAAAGAGGAWLLWRGAPGRALAAAGLLGVAGHAVIAAGVAPSLHSLWLSSRAARALTAAGWSPGEGAPGPVSVAGYEEPSLVFLLGSATELGDAQDAADAIGEGRPVIVEARQDAAFRAALAAGGLTARRAGEGPGLDYSNNQHDILRIYTPMSQPADQGSPPR